MALQRRAGDVGELAQQAAGPAVDVLLLHLSAEAGHAGPTLALRHLERTADGRRRVLDVVGVHQQRIAQLVVQAVEAVELVEVEELSASERGTGGFGSTGV